MFGFVFYLIKVAFNWFILFWIVIGLYIIVFIPGRLYFCENYPLNSFCISDTYKFITANQHKEQQALDLEQRDQIRRIKAMQARELAGLNTASTANRAQILNESLSRQSNMTQEQYLNADGLLQGKYQTDRATIEAHYQNELGKLEIQFKEKQGQLNKKYQQDTITLYKQLKANPSN